MNFIDSTVNIEETYQSAYNSILVLISYAVAVLAAIAALRLSTVISEIQRAQIRYAWIGAGSIVLGIAIWAMHFIGMLASTLPLSVGYDPGLTLVSVLPAILASAALLHTISVTDPGKLRFALGAVSIAAGIAAMHFTGMAAMRMEADILYHPGRFLLALAIVVLLASLGLVANYLLQRYRGSYQLVTKLGAAVILGLVIASMHYTVMFATYFKASDTLIIVAASDPVLLAGLIALASLIILSLNFLSSFVGEETAAEALLYRRATGTKEEEKTLIESEEFLHSLVDTLSDGIITIDAQGVVKYFDLKAETLFGYAAAEVLGNNVKMLMPAPIFSVHDGYLRRYQQTGEAHIIGRQREVTGKRKDGSTFPLQLSVGEYSHSGQQRFTGLMHDLTEVKREQEKTLIARQAAEVAIRAKSEFLASMSHEIRTPMNGVLGMLELLGLGNLDAKQKNFLETARESGQTLLKIVSDILDFSEGETGQLVLEHKQFDLRDVVEDVTNRLADQATAKSLGLSCFLPADIPTALVGDPMRLQQILVNLTSNAIKFTQEGEVTLSVAIARQAEDYLSLRFEIKDTGMGIPIEKQQYLFDAFTQQDGSNTREYGGAGLGLSIAKKLTELMGGEIGVISAVREGSIFWFTANFRITI